MYRLAKHTGLLFSVLFPAVGVATGLGRAPATALTCSAVEPAPSGCGIAGHLRYNYELNFAVGSPQIVASLEECAAFCARRISSAQNPSDGSSYEPYCSSFEFDTRSHLCQLGQQDVTKAVNPTPKSHAFYYNSDCFSCGRFCAQPFGAQLLDNGNFEDKLLGPWEAVDSSIGRGHDSARGYLCTPDQSGNCFLTQSINMCSHETYVLQFDYVAVLAPSASNPMFRAIFGGPVFEDFPNGGAFTYIVESLSNTDPKAWKTIRGYFTYLGGDHIGPYFDFRDIGVSIDNVYVARVPLSPSLMPGATSIIQNGGFESNKFAPWRTENYAGFGGMFSIVSPGIDSNYGLFFNATDFNTFASPYLVQDVATTPGSAYLVTYAVQAQKQPFDLSLYIGPNDAQFIYARSYAPGNHNFSAVVIARHNHTRVRLEFADVQAETHGSILVDNIAMVEIEPSKYYP